VRKALVSKTLVRFIIIRTIVLILTLFTAFSFTFILLRSMPVSAVENVLAGLTVQGQVIDPQAIIELRKTLYEIFGLTGSPIEQYYSYLRRFLTLDFGPSIMSYPTPARDIIFSRLPWTISLLAFTTVLSWVLGNVLGVFASINRKKGVSKVLVSLSLTLYPIPYYIMALVLIFLFCYLIPVFPLVGGFGEMSFKDIISFIRDWLYKSTLPALSIIMISMFGWWFLSSYSLTLNVQTEDYVYYAELRGLSQSRILKNYVFKNVLLPQVTTLGLSLGGIFGGALLTEILFTYPGIGMLAYRAVLSGDYPTALSMLSLTIIAVAVATYILDIVYPFIDPRIRHR
jgi:peptide/nickel transport system permease protein